MTVMAAREASSQSEFGDFQTPPDLARRICALLRRGGFEPASVIEPTCGRGAFLAAALETFPGLRCAIGVDLREDHVREARRAVRQLRGDTRLRIVQGDFFTVDWPQLLASAPAPLLILGNPPWVTNAALGALGSGNLPAKSNDDRLRGIDAITGKANFDISEWMLRRNMEWLTGGPGMLAVLCKTAVARKALAHAWSHGLPLAAAELRRIDAKRHFGASVDACLLTARFSPGAACMECGDFTALDDARPAAAFGYRRNRVVADVALFDRRHHLLREGLAGWRSGIKHDCRRVFELLREGGRYRSAAGLPVEIEDELLFPLLKSSDLDKGRVPRTWLLVPQRSTSASPETLRETAPKAWRYLLAHGDALDARGSAIYRKRPRFSIFGVGEYSFAPWKVAVAGLYKSLTFVRVAPFEGKPVLLDDTCYFFPCASERECDALLSLVRSRPAREFWASLMFRDAKRPVTAQLLNLLDFAALARDAGLESDIARALAARQSA
jgi:hypothetical protein